MYKSVLFTDREPHFQVLGKGCTLLGRLVRFEHHLHHLYIEGIIRSNKDILSVLAAKEFERIDSRSTRADEHIRLALRIIDIEKEAPLRFSSVLRFIPR